MARRLAFDHPYTGERLSIQAEPDGQWRGLCAALGWAIPDEA